MTEPVCQCTFLHEKMLEIPLNHHPKSHFVQLPTQHSIMPTWPLAENEFDTPWFRSWLPKDGAPLSARLEPIKNHSTLRSPSFSGSLTSSILASFHFQPARSHCLVVFFFSSISHRSQTVSTLALTGFARFYLEDRFDTFNDFCGVSDLARRRLQNLELLFFQRLTFSFVILLLFLPANVPSMLFIFHLFVSLI